MQQSRNVALAFLLGTFLTGGVLGFSANRYIERDKVCTTRGVNPLVDVMARKLQLTPAQSARIDSILDNRSASYRTVMAPVRPLMDSIKLEARQQMKGVLDETQRAQFEAMIKEMNDSTKKGDDQS